MAKLKLHGPQGSVLVRIGRTAADAPVSGIWTPDNLNADEIAFPIGPDDVILDGSDFEDVRLVAAFEGSVIGAETVTVKPLRALPSPGGPLGRLWIVLADVVLAPQLGSDVIVINAGLMAFRIGALTLGTATNVNLAVTGGLRVRPRS